MFKRAALFAIALTVTFSILTGCTGESNSSDVDPPVPVAKSRETGTTTANSTRADEGSRTPTIVGMTFTLPERWREIDLTDEQRSFVDARFEIPTSDEPLTLTVTSAGGGIDANVERWQGQMELEPGDTPSIDEFETNGVTAKWVDLRGTFRAGMTGGGGGPQDNWRLIGVAIPHSPRDIYLKLTGPRSIVAEIEDEVREFAKSAHAP